MKKILFLLYFLGFFSPLFAQIKPAYSFQYVDSLARSNQFIVRINFATTHHDFYMYQTTPTLDQNIVLDPDTTFVLVNDTVAIGYMPYFGLQNSLPGYGIKGIVFRGKLYDRSVTSKQRNKRGYVSYLFVVNGINDTYKITLDIEESGITAVYVLSTRRGPITYTGKIYPLPPRATIPSTPKS